jgi:hypothetical protein
MIINGHVDEEEQHGSIPALASLCLLVLDSVDVGDFYLNAPSFSSLSGAMMTHDKEGAAYYKGTCATGQEGRCTWVAIFRLGSWVVAVVLSFSNLSLNCEGDEVLSFSAL